MKSPGRTRNDRGWSTHAYHGDGELALTAANHTPAPLQAHDSQMKSPARGTGLSTSCMHGPIQAKGAAGVQAEGADQIPQPEIDG
jgi:hypothetical protein